MFEGKEIKFIAYSDIHYDRLGARCVTFDDCAAIERQVHQRAREWGADFTLFTGDRFLKRDPEDEIKTKADFVLDEELAQSVKPHFHLVGNHDWSDNSMKWHTSESLSKLVHSNTTVVIMDEPRTYHGFSDFDIHALPADHNMVTERYAIDKEKLNIFVFHDMVKGSFSNDAASHAFTDGIDLEEIDLPEFDIVLAGDIHVPQMFPFKSTQGGYLGSVLQRTKADANKARGWLEITALKGKDGWQLTKKFMPTRNFFTRMSFIVEPRSSFEDFIVAEEDCVDQLVEVKLVGRKEDVDRIADDKRWNNYVDYYNARGLDVLREYKTEQAYEIVDMSQSNSVLDDLSLYLSSGFVEVSEEDQTKIVKTVERLSR